MYNQLLLWFAVQKTANGVDFPMIFQACCLNFVTMLLLTGVHTLCRHTSMADMCYHTGGARQPNIDDVIMM